MILGLTSFGASRDASSDVTTRLEFKFLFDQKLLIYWSLCIHHCHIRDL